MQRRKSIDEHLLNEELDYGDALEVGISDQDRNKFTDNGGEEVAIGIPGNDQKSFNRVCARSVVATNEDFNLEWINGMGNSPTGSCQALKDMPCGTPEQCFHSPVSMSIGLQERKLNFANFICA